VWYGAVRGGTGRVEGEDQEEQGLLLIIFFFKEKEERKEPANGE